LNKSYKISAQQLKKLLAFILKKPSNWSIKYGLSVDFKETIAVIDVKQPV